MSLRPRPRGSPLRRAEGIRADAKSCHRGYRKRARKWVEPDQRALKTGAWIPALSRRRTSVAPRGTTAGTRPGPSVGAPPADPEIRPSKRRSEDSDENSPELQRAPGRLLSVALRAIGNIPPVELEWLYYKGREATAMGVGPARKSLRRNRGDSLAAAHRKPFRSGPNLSNHKSEE